MRDYTKRIAFVQRPGYANRCMTSHHYVRLADIASATKLSIATVSRALRNHRAIPEHTRRRVKESADNMGYRLNPMVAALMTQIRGNRAQVRANLACVHGESKSSDIYSLQLEFLAGVRSGASQLGYGISFFDSALLASAPDELLRIWKARSVHGVVLSHIRGPGSIKLPWDKFAWVVNGHITGIPDLHRVGNAIYEVVKVGLSQAIKRGYRKPGLVMRTAGESRVGFRWPAAFIGNLLRFGVDASLSWIFRGDWTLSSFRHWFQSQRPDVVLALVDQPLFWLQQMKVAVPREVGFVHLAANVSKHNAVCGVTQDFRRVGESAVYALDSELRRCELGVPQAPVTVTIAGVWREGATLLGG